MSSATRLARCCRRAVSLAGHSGFWQRQATSPSESLPTGPEHTGQRAGTMGTGASAGMEPGTTDTTLGITSPPFSTNTRQPMRTPRRSSSSALCRVARRTVEPATSTASSSATGVSLPARLTCQVMSSRVVVACRPGYLKAMAQRGTRSVKPRRSCWASSSTLSTTPSESKGSRSLGSRWASMKSTTSWKLPEAWAGMRLKPHSASWSMARLCPCAPTTCQGRKDSRRPAVIRLSSCFMVPAAALRGLAKRGSPRWSRSRFSSSQRRRDRNTSPRTSRSAGAAPGRVSGMSAMVRAFSVTSSPVSPSPRVIAWTRARPS